MLGADVWGRDADTLPGVVHRLLRRTGSTVAVAESLTGGLAGAALSAEPGSSQGFLGGVLVYATALKETLAGVPGQVLAEHGAVSAPTAKALADGVRQRTGATYGLGLTGVAGPDPQEGFAARHRPCRRQRPDGHPGPVPAPTGRPGAGARARRHAGPGPAAPDPAGSPGRHLTLR